MLSVNSEAARSALERMETIDWTERCHAAPREDCTEFLLTQYQRFLAMKIATEDWDGTLLTAPTAVDILWSHHEANSHYNADCQILANRATAVTVARPQPLPDDTSDDKKRRISTTKAVHCILFHDEYPLELEAREMWEGLEREQPSRQPAVVNNHPQHQRQLAADDRDFFFLMGQRLARLAGLENHAVARQGRARQAAVIAFGNNNNNHHHHAAGAPNDRRRPRQELIIPNDN